MQKEKIVHAAVISKNSKMIFLGKSHADCFEQADYVGVKTDGKALKQGFFTSKGRFVIREIAARIAVKAGQVRKGTTVLCSEDLWSARHGGKHSYDHNYGYYIKPEKIKMCADYRENLKQDGLNESAGMSVGLSDSRPD
jgi:hypothetical protein